QVISQPRGLFITAGFLAVLGFTPLPTIPLFATALGLVGVAWGMTRSQNKAEAAKAGPATPTKPEPPAVETLLKVDTLELEVGYALVSLVDTAQGGDLLERISAIRRQLALELGLVMPPVRIRDNMQLGSSEYRIKI